MSDDIKGFGDITQKLARNPLGIIALFIVLVYGMAALLTGVGNSMSESERLPLIYFLVAFPVLVLAVFAWLVSQHANKLFAPADFRDEENYVRTLTATASLAIASAKDDLSVSAAEVSSVVSTIREASASGRASIQKGRNQVLWVDDSPGNNVNERRALEAMGLQFTLAVSTDRALEAARHQRFAVIISDMSRPEGPRAGYDLLDRVKANGVDTPFIIYSSSDSAEDRDEAISRGAQGLTNRPQTLVQLVMQAVLSQ
ncbi:MAG TPA: response regulator [Jatrophihabitans sp.]|jgi:CheY-like chemotaxis protein|uniref:response regulator n=1 Tax=Jatrophihabitans sp. TaxID=1932789 RepID=UPI002EE1989E